MQQLLTDLGEKFIHAVNENAEIFLASPFKLSKPVVQKLIDLRNKIIEMKSVPSVSIVELNSNYREQRQFDGDTTPTSVNGFGFNSTKATEQYSPIVVSSSKDSPAAVSIF